MTATQEPKWYVMRAYKKELIVERQLMAHNAGDNDCDNHATERLPYFIAKCRAPRVRHGRKRLELVPAIPGIIFVHASRESINRFKKSCPDLQYVIWKCAEGNHYLTVPETEMAAYIKIATHHDEDIRYLNPSLIDETHLKKGVRVRIHGGVFDTVEGHLLRIKGKREKRVVVVLSGISAVSTATISPDFIEVLD